MSPEEIQTASQNGMYIHGIYLEGAKWEINQSLGKGYLVDQVIGEL